VADGDTMANDTTGTGHTSGTERVPVMLRLPADKTYVVLARSAASHLGARHGLSVAQITDLRLAIDEACGVLLLADGVRLTGDWLECRFEQRADGALSVRVSAQVAAESVPDTDGFGWSVLSALVDELSWRYDPAGQGSVALAMRAARRDDA
jgi:serine/threonine-protein kinase RsbW